MFLWILFYFIILILFDKHKTQEICGIIAWSFWITYCPVKDITQIMCDEAVDDSQAALNLIRELFVISTMIKNVFLLYTQMIRYSILIKNVVFSCNKMSILNIDHNIINLDNNFDEYDRDTNILIRALAWHNMREKCKARKKKISGELMQIT